MRYALLLVAALLLNGSVRAAEDEKLKSGPQPGTADKPTIIPASFQAWMVTGKFFGRFHSPVSEFALNPTLLIFVRSVDDDDKLLELLKQADQLAAKHPDARLGCCLVFLDDGGFRQFIYEDKAEGVAKPIAERLANASKLKDELERKFKALAEKLELKHVSIALYSQLGPKEYEINPEAHTTALLYNKQVILGNHASKAKLTEEEAARIGSDLERLVLEVERLSRPTRR